MFFKCSFPEYMFPHIKGAIMAIPGPWSDGSDSAPSPGNYLVMDHPNHLHGLSYFIVTDAARNLGNINHEGIIFGSYC